MSRESKSSPLDAVRSRQAQTVQDVQASRALIERIGRLSDGLVKIGPFRLGLDGLLAWAPGLGEVYSLGAGGVLIAQGVRAHVPAADLIKVAAIIAGRTLLTGAGETPVIGVVAKLAVDTLRGHKMSADILTRAIDATDYVHTDEAAHASRARGRRAVVLGASTRPG